MDSGAAELPKGFEQAAPADVKPREDPIGLVGRGGGAPAKINVAALELEQYVSTRAVWDWRGTPGRG